MPFSTVRTFVTLNLVLLGLFSILAPTRSAAEEAGFVIMSRGTVQIQREGTVIPAATDMAIQASDTIETGRDGTIRFAYQFGGISGTKALGPDQKLHLPTLALPADPASSGPRLSAELAQALFANPNDGEIAGAVRQSPVKLSVIFPRRQTYGAITTITWTPVKEADQYRVTVTAQQKALYSGLATASVLVLPGIPLDPTITIDVTALADGNELAKATSIPFPLRPPDRAALEAQLKTIEGMNLETSDPTRYLLQGLAFQKSGCHGEALQAFARFLQTNPESKRIFTLAQPSFQALAISKDLPQALKTLSELLPR